MVDLNKYSEREIIAAINAVQEIVNEEDFSLDIVSDEGELCFCLIDHQGVYLGDIGSDRFDSLGGVIDRMDIYHNDYFYIDYDERVETGEEIPQDDWGRKILIFLESDYISDLLSVIDVDTYEKYKDKTLDTLNLNLGEVERYVKDGKCDDVGYLCDKSIAIKIIDTQSAYMMVEYDNSVYVSAHADWYESKSKMLDDLKAGENSFCNGYSNYGSFIETEQWQVKDDMHDIGLYDESDNWGFYLSERELEYIGLGDEKDRIKDEYVNERLLGSALTDNMPEEVLCEHLDNVVEQASQRAAEHNNDHCGKDYECDYVKY